MNNNSPLVGKIKFLLSMHRLSFVFLIFQSLILVSQNDLSLIGALETRQKTSSYLSAHFSNYNIYSIELNNETLGKLDLNSKVVLNLKINQDWAFEIYPSYLLSERYKPYVNGTEQKSTDGNQAHSFYGFSGSEVISITLNDHFIYGFIKEEDGTTYNIEPLRYYDDTAGPDEYVIYKNQDVISKKVTCGVNERDQKKIKYSNLKMATSCENIQLAIASDFGMFQRYGSIAEVQNHNQGVMNDVHTSFIEEFDANIEFVIITQFIVTSAAADPFTATTEGPDLMDELEVFAAGAPWNGAFDMYQLWTTRDLELTGDFNVVGFGNRPGKHHLLEDFATGVRMQVVVAHEIGHNFNAVHDAGPDFIMSSSASVTGVWSAPSIGDVNARVLVIADDLTDCDLNSAPVAKINVSRVNSCEGNVILLEDKSLYGTSRTWATTGGTLSSTTSATPNIQFATTGTFTITLTSANGQGSDMETVDIEVIPDNTVNCSPTTQSFGTGGSAFFQLETGGGITVLSNTSAISNAVGNYENFYCSSTTQLDVNTTYNISFRGVNEPNPFQRLKLYIDYNGDGDFTDVGENVANSISRWRNGTIDITNDAGLTFNTIASPMMNVRLRLRVIVDDSDPADPCFSPVIGQIEDYAVFFGDLLPCDEAVVVNDNPTLPAYVASGSISTGAAVSVTTTSTFNAPVVNIAQDFSVNTGALFEVLSTGCN